MSNRSINLNDEVYQYLIDVSLREHPVLTALRDATRGHPRAGMQISPEQGQFMAMLVKLIGAKKTLEIGVFTGYSSLATALALPEEGRIIACDINEEFTAMGRVHWTKAGVAHKIDLRLAPAVQTLDKLIEDGEAGSFDFAFIDADKTNYDTYFERCLKLMRRGGLIVIDNVLWDGDVARPSTDADTVALQQLNRKLHKDERVDLSMLPVGDGLTLARKR